MKRTYITPVTTTVELELTTGLLTGSYQDVVTSEESFPENAVPQAREVIETPDAWDEW